MDDILSEKQDKLEHYLEFESLDTFYTTFNRLRDKTAHATTATLTDQALPPLPLYQGRGKVQIKSQGKSKSWWCVKCRIEFYRVVEVDFVNQ